VERGGHLLSKCLLLLKCPDKQRWREELLESKWSYIKERTALMKVLTVTNVTEQRKLGALSLKIKYKWEIQAKKAKLISRKEPELDVVYY
jgi:hypothetical protein